jgi:UDP-glucose 4-epimerase
MEDLKGKRIFITGGAGCIGSFVVDELLREGAKEVVVIDNFTKGQRENLDLALASNRVRLVDGDIRNTLLVHELLKGIDYCFHLASLKIIQCMAEPREALEVNINGTFNVLEACVEHKIKKIIFSSTASIYGQADFFPTPETHHPYNNKTFYGALKMANELMLRSFYRMYGLKFNILRYFNVYGPRMDANGKYTEVLIRWYRLIQQGQSPLIFGDGKQTMDFIYDEDVARATVLALKNDSFNEVFNCASGIETSLEELCQALLQAMQANLKPKYMSLPQDRGKIEVFRRLADISKAKQMLGFNPQVSLKQGLQRLVQWLNENEKRIH